jgi:hypothetical protein
MSRAFTKEYLLDHYRVMGYDLVFSVMPEHVPEEIRHIWRAIWEIYPVVEQLEIWFDKAPTQAGWVQDELPMEWEKV